MKLMKAFILTLTIILAGTTFSIASNYPTKQIHQYKLVQEQTIELPTNFAKPFIIDQKDIDLLAGKTIHHVELIYTEYAESANFNQKALNKKRIAQLKKLLPQINSDKPSWTWLEQTGAKTRSVANSYFHGFVIHYGDKLDHSSLSDFFSDIAGKTNQFNVYYPEGGDFKIATGSTISIAPNAVSYMDGSPVSGYYTLFYSEYRNSAQIALSGLPMEYQDANFSSVGMYELRAEKDGKELKLIKPMSVDFNCTKVVNDAAFYSMNDQTGEWKKEHDIQFNRNANVSEDNQAFVAAVPNGGAWNMTITSQQIDDKTSKAVLDESAWWSFKQIDKEDLPDGIISCDSAERSFLLEADKLDPFMDKIFEQKNLPQNVWNKGGKAVPNQINATLLGGGGDAGHTYPTIVRGLNSPNFGVYNCDQVYRIGEIASINPQYKDSETGEYINDGHVACVMDLTYNGSFSFHPNNLLLNKNGRNAILLFTKEKEIYLIDEKEFAQLDVNAGQTTTMPMKNVTSELKSPEDLKKMLNI
jgi:hypothetical protein